MQQQPLQPLLEDYSRVILHIDEDCFYVRPACSCKLCRPATVRNPDPEAFQQALLGAAPGREQ